MKNVAGLIELIGRYVEAERLFDDALALFVAVRPDGHSDISFTRLGGGIVVPRGSCHEEIYSSCPAT
jgi:hypothetical protein